MKKFLKVLIKELGKDLLQLIIYTLLCIIVFCAVKVFECITGISSLWLLLFVLFAGCIYRSISACKKKDKDKE